MCIYTIGVAEGLAFIHSKSILHNDLKADNIVLSDCSPVSEEPLMKLWPTIVDFSKACPTNKAKRYTLLTHQREAFKLRYKQLAPDLVDGKVEQSFLSDVYSFGMLMLKMNQAKGSSKKLQDQASKSTTYLSSDRQQLQETIYALKLLL